MAKPKTPTKPVQWADLGVPDLNDSLAANAWAHKVLVVSMHKTIADTGYNERERRKELREIAGAMRGLISQTRLHDAEAAVRGEADSISDTSRGPELEDAAQLTGSDRKPAAKRGRPRKRSTL